MLPVLRRLGERSWKTAELVEAVSEEFGLTAEERAELLPSRRQARVANRTHWALAYLNKAGLITRLGRGEYEASLLGRQLLGAPPERITLAFLTERYPGVRAFRGDVDGLAAGATDGSALAALPSDAGALQQTPDDAIDAAVTSIEAKVRDDLLEKLLSLSPAFFEKVVVDLLLAMGYGSTAADAGERLGRTGDGGVDGVIREDRPGLDVIYVQAKRYAPDRAIGPDALRSFAGALDEKGARKGVFITTSRFTAEAEGYSHRHQTKRIVLIDGDRLTRLMLAHGVGVRADRTIVLKRVDLGYFEPEDSA
jgi:restriction system protein